MRFAQAVSDVLQPRNLLFASLALLGWGVAGTGGAAWGLFAAVFAGAVPAWFIQRGVRRGAWANRHIDDRHQRLGVFVVIIASVAVSLAVLEFAGAPREIFAAAVCLLAVAVVLLAVTPLWKISVHAMVAGSMASALGSALSGWWWAASTVVVAVVWSRIATCGHTPAQAATGALTGAGLAALSFAVLL
ncbi:hypothetical protein LN042_19735 [Kitasatospora sp. RB6PN24]|uniref:hypothetical protein n=1 Tax=Kitasatospora humi TaxID=2893891 RepID=UPI001E4BB066|nr:hypothetical protein [Kitasatospora humi]MCC9309290.1 hypothetical protein [Kitasatospora humi]